MTKHTSKRADPERNTYQAGAEGELSEEQLSNVAGGIGVGELQPVAQKVHEAASRSIGVGELRDVAQKV